MESRYWKEFLASTAKELAWKKSPKRLTERRLEIMERDVILSFFIVRRLIELHRISLKTIDFKFEIFSCPYNGRPLRPTNRHWFEESYDLENEKKQNKKTMYIANQFIHSTLFLMLIDETRNWDSFYVVSDYDKKNCIWRIPAKQVYDCLKLVSDDYLELFSYKYDEAKDNYIIEIGKEQKLENLKPQKQNKNDS
ncbi:MAG: hypothetical protein K8R74_09210 [Bacteroidales bacterium]|nr:hypothetical protein [Bacteroidales bacterium]